MTRSLVSSRSLHVAAFFALALCATGCSKREAPATSSAPAAAVEAKPASGATPATATEGGAGAKPLAASRALIVTIEMAITAKNPDAVAARLRDEVERAGGFVADANATGSGDYRSARLVLRVPADRTKSIRAAIADHGQVTSDTEKSEDVTEQRADLDARLSNARTQEKRLQEIMGNRTGSVADVLEVERELGRVRETIERLDAQKRTLDGKIDLATVTVNINATTPPPPPEEGALAKIADAFHGGVHATGVLALYGAMAFAAVSPVLVPMAIVAGMIVVVARRRRRAQLAAMASIMQGAAPKAG